MNLTGIRGLAAIWVVFFHFEAYLKDIFSELKWIFQIIDRGYFGVDLFFCLSGFIIAHVYFERCISNPKDKRMELKHFFLKRFARLYPVYILTTLLALAMFIIANFIGHKFGKLSDDVLTFSIVIKNLLAIQILDDSYSLNYPSWSVSAEFFAYLSFPILVYGLFLKFKRTRLIAGILFLSSLFIYEYSIFFDFLNSGQLVRALTEFVMGLTCYLLIRKMIIPQKYIFLMRFVATSILIILLYSVRNDLILSAFVPLLFLGIVALNYFHNIPNKGLGRKVFVKLGLWSYSLYLTHGLFHYFLGGFGLPIRTDKIFLNFLQLLAILWVTPLIAKLTTELVEIPCRRFLLKKFNYKEAS